MDRIEPDVLLDLLQKLIKYSPLGYSIIDTDFRFHYYNESFVKIKNFGKEDFGKKYCYEISNCCGVCDGCKGYFDTEFKNNSKTNRKTLLNNGEVTITNEYAIPLNSYIDGKRLILKILVDRTDELKLIEEKHNNFNNIVSIFSNILDAKDKYTAEHSTSVKNIAVKIAKKMGLSNAEVFEISAAANLHDIGKVRIPLDILNKPGKLTDNEFKLIKSHSSKSAEILNQLLTFNKIRDIALYHHERIDGKGYPKGLKGDEIPLGSRIIAVADTYDAMTSTRAYRSALSHEVAIDEIKNVAGTQLDKTAVEAFLSLDVNISSDVDTKDEYKAFRGTTEEYSIEELEKINSKFPDALCDKEFLITILDHSPCGYLFVDEYYNVVFTSTQFKENFGITEDIINKKCYDATGFFDRPCEKCGIRETFESNKICTSRLDKMTYNGRMIFDTFTLPFIDKNGKKYGLEMIVNRTEEMLYELEMQEDLKKLIDILMSIMVEEHLEFNPSFHKKLIKLGSTIDYNFIC